MKIKNVFPEKPKFRFGEKIGIVACMEEIHRIDDGFLVFSIFKYNELIQRSELFFDEESDKYAFQFLINSGSDSISDYKVEVDFYDNMGYLESSSTTFDVVA